MLAARLQNSVSKLASISRDRARGFPKRKLRKNILKLRFERIPTEALAPTALAALIRPTAMREKVFAAAQSRTQGDATQCRTNAGEAEGPWQEA